MSQMNLWLWGVVGLCAALVPVLIRCFRGPVEDRLIGLEFGGIIVIMQLMLLVQGFGRAPFFDLPLTLTFLSFGGGLVFVRFLERWL